tara:strand:- start:13315 stop:14274 length:960 start_codon:yes stop_codon:yes gene_type:complete
MNKQTLTITLALAGLVMLSDNSNAQDADTYTPTKTAWGDPDIQGVWNNNTTVPLQRPDGAGETITDEGVAARRAANEELFFGEREGDTGFYNDFWFEYGQDTNRSSLIIEPSDGKLPALTADAEKERVALQTHRYQNSDAPGTYTDLSVYDRCITRGLPGSMMPGFYNHNYHIMQTPNYVAIVVEMIHDARIIPLDGREHAPSAVRQWLGDSRGHWEGNTLVVETTNFNEKVTERGLFVPTVFGSGKNLRLIEHFTRVDDETIDYRFKVEDSTTFTSPWTALIPMNKFEGTLFEYACHEGNYAMANILRGARAAEKGSN